MSRLAIFEDHSLALDIIHRELEPTGPHTYEYANRLSPALELLTAMALRDVALQPEFVLVDGSLIADIDGHYADKLNFTFPDVGDTIEAPSAAPVTRRLFQRRRTPELSLAPSSPNPDITVPIQRRLNGDGQTIVSVIRAFQNSDTHPALRGTSIIDISGVGLRVPVDSNITKIGLPLLSQEIRRLTAEKS